MEMNEIERDVIRFLSLKLGVDESEVVPEASLDWDLGCDPLDIAEIVVDSELEFGIDLPDEVADRFSNLDLPSPTVSDLVQAITKEIMAMG